MNGTDQGPHTDPFDVQLFTDPSTCQDSKHFPLLLTIVTILLTDPPVLLSVNRGRRKLRVKTFRPGPFSNPGTSDDTRCRNSYPPSQDYDVDTVTWVSVIYNPVPTSLLFHSRS